MAAPGHPKSPAPFRRVGRRSLSAVGLVLSLLAGTV